MERGWSRLSFDSKVSVLCTDVPFSFSSPLSLSLSPPLPPPLFLGHLGILAIVLLILDRSDTVDNRGLGERQLPSSRGDGFAGLLEDAS